MRLELAQLVRDADASPDGRTAGFPAGPCQGPARCRRYGAAFPSLLALAAGSECRASSSVENQADALPTTERGGVSGQSVNPAPWRLEARGLGS